MAKQTVEELAHRIRIAALLAPNKDTLSCEFGNWFAERTENLIKEFLVDNEIQKEKYE